MATTIPATPRDPKGVDVPVGGAYNTGPNPYPGGTLEVNDAMPLADRADGTSEEQASKRESVERQLGKDA